MDKLRVDAPARADLLKACPLFADLEIADRQRLAGRASLRGFAANETLFRQGAPALGLYVVASGKVAVTRQGLEGRGRLLHLFGPGEVVGEVPTFAGGAYPAEATAAGEATALFLLRDDLLATGRDRPEVLLAMLATLSQRLRHFVALVDDLSLKDIPARLAVRLLALAEAQGGDKVVLPVAKRVLAAEVGAAPETLSRLLRKLQDGGVIVVSGRRITLRNRARLTEIAGRESGAVPAR
jgi:CRP/FNR family transcriptional regulator, dissimilatory nitrate respiration regulator